MRGTEDGFRVVLEWVDNLEKSSDEKIPLLTASGVYQGSYGTKLVPG